MDTNLVASLALALTSLGSLGCGGAGPASQHSEEPGQGRPPRRTAGVQEIPDSIRASLEESAVETLQRLQATIDDAPGGIDEENRLTLEEPIVFSSIPAAALLEDGPGGDGLIENLLDRTDRRVIYPVRHGDRIVSSMLFRLNNLEDAPGAARPPSVSTNRADPFTLLVEEARRRHRDNRPEINYKGVSIFSLNQHFLYYSDGEQEMMMPIASDPGMGFIGGEPLPANEVLERLRKQLTIDLTREEAPG